jgi:uncharacterized protein YukE
MANLTITERVLAFLNITDAGKINNFYLKQQSQLNKDIKNLNKNLDTISDNHEEALEDLQEKLDDAKIRVEEAYQGVTPEDVATNEKAASFADKYWYTVEQAEYVVASIEQQIEKTKELYTDTIESVQKQIAERQRRLAKLA